MPTPLLDAATPAAPHLIELTKIFAQSPFVYSALLLLSLTSTVIWLYSLSTLRLKQMIPDPFLQELKGLLRSLNYERAENLCRTERGLLSSLVLAGLETRKLGPQLRLDAMKAEGKRASMGLWQRLSLLNEIVVIAPMLGLLGTVIGMFYAFYDVNRSIESINALFDGLGIAVGTTVMGLLVAILSMLFHISLKYRLIKTLSFVEAEAASLSSLIEG